MANDGTGANWDTSDPADTANVKDGAKQIRDLRVGLATRLTYEHTAPAGSSAGGVHKAGSAIAFAGNATPTTLLNGTALGSGDKGRIWIDETTGKLYGWNGTTWVQLNATSTTSKVAIVQEQQLNGTASGTFTAGAWTQRTLNTILADASSIVAALTANRFTLGAGTYHISVRAGANQVDRHQVRIVKDPAGSPAYTYGQSSFSNSGATNTNDQAQADGAFVLSGATAFEIQHRCQTTKSTVGFGSSCSFGNTEVFTSVVITKVA